VEAVRSALHAAEHAPRHEVAWKPGTPCALNVGPLAGASAVVLSIHRDTATLAVMMFGALRQVQAPLAWLVARE
jgi:transcription antitermination factor NusG